MIIDGLLSFDGYPATSFSFNQAAAAYNSVNNIDLHMTTGVPVLAAGQGARDMGIGDDPALKLLVQVLTTFTGAGASLQVGLQGAPDAGNGTPGTFVTWWLSPAYALAALVQGARLYDMDMPRPPQGVPIPRFLRMSYTIAGAAGTGGTLASFIVLDRFDQVYNATNNAILGGYPPGIIIAN
jgi:hypothetical protein